MVVVDADRSRASRELISRFEASDNFTIVGRARFHRRDRSAGSKTGRAWMALSIPPGYGDRDRRAARPRRIQVVADGTDSNSTNVALGYARVLVAGYTRGSARARDPAGRRRSGSSTPAIRVWFNPDLESRDFMIPGIVALLLLVVTTNLSAMAIVREKELGHARAAERHAARALGADRRQAPAVRRSSA